MTTNPIGDLMRDVAPDPEVTEFTRRIAATLPPPVPFPVEDARATSRLAGLELVGENVVDGRTGEVVQVDDPVAATALFGDTLATYARAKVQAQALKMRLDDMEAAVVADLAKRPEYAEALDQRCEALRVMAEVEAVLGGLFGDRRQKVSIDTTAVMVTWGKPRETWSLAHEAAWYAKPAAWRELVDRLAGCRAASLTDEETANRVILWLGPHAKTGATSAPTITVRDAK